MQCHGLCFTWCIFRHLNNSVSVLHERSLDMYMTGGFEFRRSVIIFSSVCCNWFRLLKAASRAKRGTIMIFHRHQQNNWFKRARDRSQLRLFGLPFIQVFLVHSPTPWLRPSTWGPACSVRHSLPCTPQPRSRRAVSTGRWQESIRIFINRLEVYRSS
jgi:hypothetical protein